VAMTAVMSKPTSTLTAPQKKTVLESTETSLKSLKLQVDQTFEAFVSMIKPPSKHKVMKFLNLLGSFGGNIACFAKSNDISAE
jgi:hypothetical protein